jgi:hypothetical protein
MSVTEPTLIGGFFVCEINLNIGGVLNFSQAAGDLASWKVKGKPPKHLNEISLFPRWCSATLELGGGLIVFLVGATNQAAGSGLGVDSIWTRLDSLEGSFRHTLDFLTFR